MEELVSAISHIQNPKTWFILCSIFIFGDVFTGYLKAFKFKKLNSSVSRDGYVKKIGWVTALLIGWLVDFFVGVNMTFIGTAIVCVATEGISVYENLGEIGVKVPFKQYFAKLKDSVDKE